MKISLASVRDHTAARSGVRFVTSLILASSAALAHAGSAVESSDVVIQEESSLAAWWNGKTMTGDWFGYRDTLEDYGLKFNGKYAGAFYGVVDSQKGSRGFYDQEVAFGAELDFGKLTRAEALQGLTAFGNVRWRDSRANSNPNNFVQASSLFQPSHFQSGTQWRILSFGLQYSTPQAFGVENFLTVRGGWLQPQKEFIDQPLSKLFVNNAIESAKGIGGNIPFSSSFSSWGGTLQVKPTSWSYAKGGLFMAFPQATSSSNHGLAFQGFAQDLSQNGLLAMVETGVKPEIGENKLPGKYAAGGYYYGQGKDSFNGTSNYGQFGFYWQGDQMLFRESSEIAPVSAPQADGKSTVDSKSFKSPVEPEAPKLSKQGLYSFNLLTFAPKYNNLYSFYFQSGLVYEGLIPTRDKDRTMFVIGYGSYSLHNIDSLQQNGKTNQPNYTMVLEWDYRVQVNDWAFVQPFAQYIVQPNGTGAVKNATVLGVLYGMAF